MITTAIIIAFVVLFLHACTWEGMIFGFVSKKLHRLPDYIKKPLYDCPICMSPYYGSLIILSSYYFGGHDLPSVNDWFLILLMAAGINTVLIYIVSASKAISKSLGDDYDCNCTKKESPEEKQASRKKRMEYFQNQST